MEETTQAIGDGPTRVLARASPRSVAEDDASPRRAARVRGPFFSEQTGEGGGPAAGTLPVYAREGGADVARTKIGRGLEGRAPDQAGRLTSGG